MSDEKKYTERERIAFMREAFTEGRLIPYLPTRERAWAEAVERYPLPKVSRPRVVADPHMRDNAVSWRVVDDVIQYRYNRDPVIDSWIVGPPDFLPTRERVVMWADLLANPVEIVEDSDA